jgi:hypothetical protein
MGRLIVVCVPIQKRRQMGLGGNLIGWERRLGFDVEVAASAFENERINS